MSTFYLLPPRPLVGDQLLDGVERLLPGLDLTVAARRRLTEAFIEALELRDQVYLVFREDLPVGVPPEEALRDGFGAEAGDEVIEVRSGSAARRWQVGSIAASLGERVGDALAEARG